MAVTTVKVSKIIKGLEPAEIAEKIKEKFPDEIIDITNFRDQIAVIVKRGKVFEILKYLHDDPLLSFDHLQDLTAVDWLNKKEPRFEVVYNLFSIRYGNRIRIKAQVPGDDPKITSVVPIWAGANWHERECYDMFGIVFTGHPDLRRILLPEDWEGHPLRKDYPLKGPELDKDWEGFRELIKKSEELKVYEWKG